MYVECPRCGATYYRDKHWKRVCLECWQEEKGYSLDSLNELLSEKKEEIDDLRYELATVRSDKRLKTEFKVKLKNLIFLCHPDKHANSAIATEVTQWLLEYKNEFF